MEGFALGAPHEVGGDVLFRHPAKGVVLGVEGDGFVPIDFDGEDGHHEDVVVGFEVEGFQVFDLPHVDRDEVGFFAEFAERSLDGGFFFAVGGGGERFDPAVDGLPGALVLAGGIRAVYLKEFDSSRSAAVDVDGDGVGADVGHRFGLEMSEEATEDTESTEDNRVHCPQMSGVRQNERSASQWGWQRVLRGIASGSW